MDALGIPLLKCPVCQSLFYERRRGQIYCSQKCIRTINAEKTRANHPYQRKGTSRVIKICKSCNKEFTTNTATQLYCTKECYNNWYQAQVRTVGKFIIFERDNFKCFYCGKSSYGDDAELHVDHIHPRSLGGKNIASNLVTACKECNLTKTDMVLRGECEMLEEVQKRNTRAEIKPELKIKFLADDLPDSF